MELYGFNSNLDCFVCIEELKWKPVPLNIFNIHVL